MWEGNEKNTNFGKAVEQLTIVQLSVQFHGIVHTTKKRINCQTEKEEMNHIF